MRLRGSHPVKATDRGLGILAAWLGAMVGGVVVGGSAVLIARAAATRSGRSDVPLATRPAGPGRRGACHLSSAQYAGMRTSVQTQKLNFVVRETAVDAHECEFLDLGLGDEHAVEGISMMRR